MKVSKETPPPSFEEMIESIVDKRIAEKQEPLLQEIAILNSILEDIPLQLSTNDAMALSGLSRYMLEKEFKPAQAGEKGQLWWNRIEIKRWVKERELKAA